MTTLEVHDEHLEGAPVRDRRAPLKLDPAAFREAGHELVEAIAELLEGLPNRPTTGDATPEVIQAAVGTDAPLPEDGTDARTVVRSAANLLFEHSLFNGHPRFLGYVTSSPVPIGMLGDLLAAAVNAHVGAWTLSPAASEIEAQTVRWIAEFVGYPVDCGGLPH